jgi:hypothetical protein
LVIPDHHKTFHHSHGRIAYSTVVGNLAVAEPSLVFNPNEAGSTIGKAELSVFSYSRQSSNVVYTLPHIVGQRADRFIDHLAWSPNGSKLAFSTYRIEPDLENPKFPPRFVYSVKVYDLDSSTIKSFDQEIASVSSFDWISDSQLAVSVYNDVRYWVRDKGERKRAMLADRSLTPEFFDQIGLDHKYLSRDRILLYDFNGAVRREFSGHALTAYPVVNSKK